MRARDTSKLTKAITPFRSSPHGVFAATLGAHDGEKVGVGLEHEVAGLAYEEDLALVYIFHNV
jgi:hypothetical protein